MSKRQLQGNGWEQERITALSCLLREHEKPGSAPRTHINQSILGTIKMLGRRREAGH